MRVAGLMAICDFPMWEMCAKELCEVADDVYVRFDGVQGDPEILRRLREVMGAKLRKVQVVREAWHPPEWREDMIRMLDNAEHKPDVVLVPDQDEVFGDGLREELAAFWASDKRGMMFSYEPLATHDGRGLNGNVPYPPEPHMKAFKWERGLSYWPWHRHAIVARYVNPACWWTAKTKIKHYCAYTDGLADAKKWRSDTPAKLADKPITLLGFGASAKQGVRLAGEVWSLNNCYETFETGTLKYITRIFDMHRFGPRGKAVVFDKETGLFTEKQLQNRDFLLAGDGKTHVWHLDELGRLGHRIVLHEPHHAITNSEAFPVQKIEAYLGGVSLWGGTGAYMVAAAVFEGATEIVLYGFDQMDWEHVLQRESMAWWLGFAAGRGIKLSGELAILRRHTRRYGYDYGPEWDERCNAELWRGYPFEVRMKTGSTSVAGDLFRK